MLILNIQEKHVGIVIFMAYVEYMRNIMLIIDQEQRQQALDATQSFIVQAPAGSGKTELLTQRYLTLLTKVRIPEEIIAITFTRKAANEMHNRIIDALNAIANQQAIITNGFQIEAKHIQKQAAERINEYMSSESIIQQNLNSKNEGYIHNLTETTTALVKQVLIQNQKLGWELLDNPSRLRIMTIDSLCASIIKQKPILAKLGTEPNISADPQNLYKLAVEATLAHLEEDLPWTSAIENLLLHLDNNYQMVSALLIDMLERRDQWLPHITKHQKSATLKDYLQQSLSNLITDQLENLRASIPLGVIDDLLACVTFAAQNLRLNNIDIPLAQCWQLAQLPNTTLEGKEQWQAIANLFLTKDKKWRRSLNRSLGFPSASDKGLSIEEKMLYQSMKQKMTHIFNTVQQTESMQQHLIDCLNLPANFYTEQQWTLIQALIDLLPVLAAQLLVIFQEQGMVDFIEVSNSAINAFAESDQPSELALELDYKIQHILIDEFQDTSATQYRLLENLTAQWQQHDGKTLFIVGDPMQSIYRFREAEVGLFLRAKTEGVGQIKLVPLTLQVNFRSQSSLVNWFNNTMVNIFPAYEDFSSGAVSYSSAIAYHQTDDLDSVQWHLFNEQQEYQEAQRILEIIKQTKIENPPAKIAILVKARHHLIDIINHLRRHNIAYRAIEIDGLSQRVVIQDLYMLTRGLLHLADRIAWFALLRAPWCGLTLHDLLAIANDDQQQTVWQNLLQYQNNVLISDEGKLRIEKIIPILHNALLHRNRKKLSVWIYSIWLSLGGPACVNSQTELEDAKVYLQLLDDLEVGGTIDNYLLLDNKIQSLFATPDTEADDSLQIMTIHKAKGLEFDIVILPGLARRSPPEKNRLLMWLQRPRPHTDESDLILAPIKSSVEDDPIYYFLNQHEKKRSAFENGRLLYVALTRAKHQLHLLGSIKFVNDEVQKPVTGSFLSLLWQWIPSHLLIDSQDLSTQPQLSLKQTKPLRRLPLQWCLPQQYQHIDDTSLTNTQTQIENIFAEDYQNEFARILGIVIHRTLQQIAIQGFHYWSAEKIQKQIPFWQSSLLALGLQFEQLNDALQLIQLAINNSLQDERGRWILSNDHEDAVVEYPLTTMRDDDLYRIIVDRSFVDRSYRWIIDYKTSHPQQDPLDDFLLHQKKIYLDKLQLYAQAIKIMDDKPIKIGLYFPLVPAWIEWDYQLG